MITMQQLVKSIRNTDKFNGVISKEQAERLVKDQYPITTFSIMEVGPDNYYVTKALFFSDHHGFGYSVLPSTWTPATTYIPLECAPRPSLPGGVIYTVDDYMTVFHNPETLVIETLEELVDYVNSQDDTN